MKAGAPPEVADRVARTLATLRAEPQLLAADDGLRATIDLTVPEFAPIPPTASASAQLTPQELAAFEQKIDQWDSFLVFAIKQMGETSGTDQQLRDDLLALLLDSRHRLVEALANPQSGGPDPIRLLFLDEWQRLGEVIREASRRGTLGSQSLQFLSFMSAGDALFALDQAAPALGMRISSEDLRRLAHMIGPTTANPLGFSFEEDPEAAQNVSCEGAALLRGSARYRKQHRGDADHDSLDQRVPNADRDSFDQRLTVAARASRPAGTDALNRAGFVGGRFAHRVSVANHAIDAGRFRDLGRACGSIALDGRTDAGADIIVGTSVMAIDARRGRRRAIRRENRSDRETAGPREEA